jgi:AcrR family transcriptional regulator
MRTQGSSKHMRKKQSPPPRDRILRVARRLLARKGFAELSLREVARQAKLAPSSIYEHFSSREALLEALAIAALDELREELVGGCAVEGSASDRLLNAASMYLDFSVARRSEFELIFSRSRPADQVEPPAYSPLMPIVAEISRAVGSGEFTAPGELGVLDMALSLWTQVHGMAVLRTRYLASTVGFEQTARRIISATIEAWVRPNPRSSVTGDSEKKP